MSTVESTQFKRVLIYALNGRQEILRSLQPIGHPFRGNQNTPIPVLVNKMLDCSSKIAAPHQVKHHKLKVHPWLSFMSSIRDRNLVISPHMAILLLHPEACACAITMFSRGFVHRPRSLPSIHPSIYVKNILKGEVCPAWSLLA